MILADTSRSLLETVGIHLSRSLSLLCITIAALLPLCMLKDLHALAPFSILGTTVFFLAALVMGIRYFDGTYDVNRSGRFLEVTYQ